MISRRDFLEATGAATLAGQLAWAAPADGGDRKRLAIIANVWTYLSHAQHMGDRFLLGYPFEGKWQQPAIDVVSLYVDQKPKGEIGIGGSLSASLLPHHRAYGSVPRRFGWLNFGFRFIEQR